MLLSDVRRLTLHYVSGSPLSQYLIPATEVDRFVEASKRLHHDPGRNPHNGVGAAKIWQITVAELTPRGPFWWTTPDLQRNNDPAGAHIIDSYHERIVWTDEEYVARCNAEEAEAEAKHFRAVEKEARQRRSLGRH